MAKLSNFLSALRPIPSESFLVTAVSGGPEADYMLEESSGTAIADSSGNGHTGVVVGSVSFQQPRPSSQSVGILVSGASNRINTQYVIPTTDVTLAFWMKQLSYGGDYDDRTIGVYNGSGAANAWEFVPKRGSGFASVLIRDAAAVDYSFDAGAQPTVGVWYHYIMSISSTAGGKVYRDGVLINSNASAVAYGNATSSPLHIGNFPSSSRADVVVDDVQVYTSALSDADALSVYETGAPSGVVTQTEFVLSRTIDANTLMAVCHNGVELREYSGWVRNVGNNSVILTETSMHAWVQVRFLN